MIRQKRLERGLSLKEVAAQLDISESFLSQIENKKRKPSPELITALAKYFASSPDEISISVGILPNWIINKLMADPVRAIRSAIDNFSKYE